MDALLGLARTYALQRDLESAEEYYLLTVKAWPDYWGGYNELGAFYFDNNHHPEALKEWRRVVELDPESASGRNNLCSAQIKLGNYLEAISECNLALKKPAPDIYVNLGAAYYYLGQSDSRNFAEAVTQIQKGLDLNRELPSLWGNRADAHFSQPGKSSEAINDYTQALLYAQRELHGRPSDDPGFAIVAEWHAKRSVAERADRPQQSAADAAEAINKIRNVLDPDEKMAPRKNQDCAECLASGVLVYHLLEDATRPDHRQQSLVLLELALKQRYSLASLENDPFLREIRAGRNYQQIVSKYR
jgi:tetratricopeptide (TPR) repeat protein